MNFLAIFVIALALAIDSFAVSLTYGLQLKRIATFQTLKIGSVFGGFQFFMPVVGWWLGKETHQYIEQYDHWIAFALLAFLGGRMIKEVWHFRHNTSQPAPFQNLTDNRTLFMLGIATSLDALAVGLSFSLLDMTVWGPAMIIGLVSFIISAVGLHIGRFITRVPGLGSLGNKANIFGGVVLVAIGINILYQHGVFA